MEQKMSKSAMANVDDLLAMQSDQLYEQNIHNICSALEALVYGVEEGSTT
jgi:hypothetical protein